jgi:hypothetical protein
MQGGGSAGGWGRARGVSSMTCHPSPGFMLIGSDVKLNSPSSLISQALTEILQHPERARDALRVLLHLVRPRVRDPWEPWGRGEASGGRCAHPSVCDGFGQVTW